MKYIFALLLLAIFMYHVEATNPIQENYYTELGIRVGEVSSLQQWQRRQLICLVARPVLVKRGERDVVVAQFEGQHVVLTINNGLTFSFLGGCRLITRDGLNSTSQHLIHHSSI